MPIVTASEPTLVVVASLAIWRVTHLLTSEDGPGDFLARLRRAAGEGALGRLLDCFYCLSFWVAAPFAWILGAGWPERILLWLALSGAAVLLERWTSRAPPPALWREEVAAQENDEENHEEKDHVLR